MKNKIRFQYVNENETQRTDIDCLSEFHRFLQGDMPEGMKIAEGIKLSPQQAFSIIYYLQEHLRVFPDNIEICCKCGEIFDSNDSGEYFSIEFQHYCDSCIDESEGTYCYECGTELWKDEANFDDGYYCDGCMKAINKD